MLRYLTLASPALASAAATPPPPFCRTTPSDASWPTPIEWSTLNATISGSLIRTVPVASSCWPSTNTTFTSPLSCQEVNDNWSNGTWHSQQPESIDYQLYANNSCLPDEVGSWSEKQGCSVGGLPQYIVNATEEVDVAAAMKWAVERNVRIVVKGTGHDLNGRSSGAFSLSIWTHNFRNLSRDKTWRIANSSSPAEDVFIVGSGQQWGNVLSFATSQGRVVTTGQDPSVGLGGYIQGGGHGPLASTYGLASSQVLQMTVVTTTGHVLVANEVQNEDLFWALRGGGAGQYGVVTEYVIKHYPAPRNVVMASVQIKPKGGTNASMEASWSAVASWLSALPDLMDAGLAGAATVAVGSTAPKFFPDIDVSNGPFTGIGLNQVFWAFNTTPAAVEALVQSILTNLLLQSSTNTSTTGNDSSLVSTSMSTSTHPTYSSFFTTISGDNVAGGESLTSSRLLGRAELVSTPHPRIVSYLKTAMASQNTTSPGNYATIGLSGGPGVHSTPSQHWGALHPSWRTAYLHFIATGATIDSRAAGSAKRALSIGAAWHAAVKEPMWEEWAPSSGAYMNEANPYVNGFQKVFYGEGYERLVEVKRKYDPSGSLFVLAGVGTEGWEYDLDSGRLCRV
ncbi:hypothetical protein J4E89_006868 [Alternaria sp. Ai002NY15]|nr:hypothetical protein J4E89_006868 [Alternaria sp. Ai002NY15]